MKKLLIIQQDEAYFLFETIRVLENHQSALKDFDYTILVSPESYKAVFQEEAPLLKGITTNVMSVQKENYDVSINLSMKESSWDLHGLIKSQSKIGPYQAPHGLMVPDLWSSYLLTLKTKAPFLTFHLQDVYKNILGIKNLTPSENPRANFNQIAFGMTATNTFPAGEQETFINELVKRYPHIAIKDISEIDLIEDMSQTLYIGPATLEALKFCEAGGKGVFLMGQFQGFNLLPYREGHLFISSRNRPFESQKLLGLIHAELTHTEVPASSPYSLYRNEHENIFGAYLKSLNLSDDNYPFYQSHVVLWNFLLNLFDTNLEITKCSDSQLELLKNHHHVMTKLLRLHDYAMVSIDTIYQEAKSPQADGGKIEGHLKNLRDIDQLCDQISASHSLVRPILDFYRIRRGQNSGETLVDQSQSSYLTYSEEHQALAALHELFSVTLKRNEVNI